MRQRPWDLAELLYLFFGPAVAASVKVTATYAELETGVMTSGEILGVSEDLMTSKIMPKMGLFYNGSASSENKDG